jgi:hypothetical protein
MKPVLNEGFTDHPMPYILVFDSWNEVKDHDSMAASGGVGA